MTSKEIILNISVNLARVSEWVLFDTIQKQKRVDQFLNESSEFLGLLSSQRVSKVFEPTLSRFQRDFAILLKKRNDGNNDDWAEEMLTWANILMHRAKLA